MVSFPHCKINLGLRVLRKRPDGYHDLETLFYPLPLKDVLEIIPSAQPGPSAQPDAATILSPAQPHASARPPTQFTFTVSGLPIPGDPAGNLCAKAWHLLKKDFPDLPPVNGWLYKNIPMGAGLGGGSADGAFMLKMLDSIFQLEIGPEKLAAYALRLGSDCPFFLYDQPCFAGGRGELLEPATIDIDLSAWAIALVHPGIHISTAQAFAELEGAPAPASSRPPSSLKEIIAQPVTSWRTSLVNDFEAPLCKRYPELQKIKDCLYDSGAVYASMTGSGSAFYGLFPKPQTRDSTRLPDPERSNILTDASALAGARPLPDASLFPGYFFRIL